MITDWFWMLLTQLGFVVLPWGAFWIPEEQTPGMGVCGFDEGLGREWCT